MRGRGCLLLSVFLVALALAPVGLAVLLRELDPATAGKRAAALAYQQQMDAIDLADRRRNAERWAAVWSAWEPAVKGAGAVLIILTPAALAVGVLELRRELQHRRALIYPDARGLLPVPHARLAEGHYDAHAAHALGGWHVSQAEAARNPVHELPRDLRTYAPRYGAPAAPRVIGRPDDAPTLTPPPSAVALPLPGPTDLGRVLTAPPTLDRVLLALGPGGAPIVAGARDMGHIAFAGATGGGKSNLLRLLLAQLLAAGARAVLTDPHYAPVDAETGEDWRPIAGRLLYPPAVAPGEIADLLAWLSEELDGRLARRREGEHAGPPLYWAADELPAIVAQVPGADATLGRVVREGRKVKLYAVTSAQDWLTRTVGGSQAMKENFLTAFYTGGDAQSARLLLDMRGPVDDAGLGRGLAWLRCKATPSAQLVRVPLASNEAIAGLLPAPTGAAPAPWTILPGGAVGRSVDAAATVEPPTAPVDADRPTDRPTTPRPLRLSGKARAAGMDLSGEEWGYLSQMDRGRTPQTIAREVTGQDGGRVYGRLRDELQALADMVRNWPDGERWTGADALEGQASEGQG